MATGISAQSQITLAIQPVALAACFAPPRVHSWCSQTSPTASRSPCFRPLGAFPKRRTPLLRRAPSPVYVSTGSPHSSDGAVSTDTRELKAQLEACLLRDSAVGAGLSADALELISQLEKLNPTPGAALRPDLWAGPFRMLDTTMQANKGAPVSLGRATFNAFKPNGLMIRMDDIYNDVHVHGPNAYDTLIPFTIVEDGVPPLRGLLYNEATVSVASKNDVRLDVQFLRSMLRPLDESVDLEAWLAVFREVNPGMDCKGVCTLALPPAQGWLDITYLDEDLRITHGSRGGIVVVKRMPAPAVEINS